MKSIIQEASSVLKAIEKAWVSAEKPQEFTIKIFEESEKNFIGMTVKPAKIGIFFTEESLPKKDNRPKKETFKRKIPPIKKQTTKSVEKKEEAPVTVVPEQKPQKRVMWTNEMIEAARKWIDNALKAMEKPSINFTTDVNNYYLRFVFDQPVAATDEKERELFRSFSFLLLQTLKRKFKRPLRGFKVVLTR